MDVAGNIGYVAKTTGLNSILEFFNRHIVSAL